ncbi:MAG: putative ATP-dependent RNA helicase DHR1 [Pycnora praestabilis]|nr:MAG: putative ATP-dependent RNA helicase DHR1 [Pycnora praestabilis]
MPKFVPRQRKHKNRQKEVQHGGPREQGGGDSNATEILPPSKSEKEEKRRRLKEEMRSQQPKMSSKKQKRLDKYIENKLKKDENLELLKKLSQTKVDTSLLRSSKNLGTGKESKREVLSRALREQQAGLDVEGNKRILFEERRAHGSDSDREPEESGSDYQDRETLSADTIHAQALQPSVGSGLKRPPEVGDDGNPVIKRRKRSTRKPQPRIASLEPSWEGFNSDSGSIASEGSDSALDAESPITEEDFVDQEVSENAELSSKEPKSDPNTEGDEETESKDESSSEEDDTRDPKARSSVFKAWANQQRNETYGFTPSGTTETIVESNQHAGMIFKPRPVEQEPLPPELATMTATDATRKAFSVQVDRSPEIQERRLSLPVVVEEQKIMEAIHNNPSIVIWGATGSGKTTQVPQFLYEAGYGSPCSSTPGMIGITQPRRVAAVSMAKRVAVELGKTVGKVDYQIRFETTVSDKTAIKYMTDGVLLREIGQDIALKKYSAIVIDEAHERSVNTDILIGMMSRIVDLRLSMNKDDPKIPPLKLIIMSATLRISDFTENTNLFKNGPPPLLQAEGRQYPVSIHFSRRTERDYLDEAFRKISKGHRKLPPGGMLVFLTGQNEIMGLSKRLKAAFTSTQNTDVKGPSVRNSANEAPLETEDIDLGDFNKDQVNGDDSEIESEILGLDDEDDHEFDVGESTESSMALHVLPLYSQLPNDQQMRVFEDPPDGSRLIVLATNVAETSLTIPGIRYVFDCGRAKERRYGRTTGVQSFEVGWISKASASQRAGRAGRTGAGHCYRLYSSAVYERDFEEHAEPEILRMPIEGVVLQLKSMNIDHVVNFPFPTPPDRHALAKAEKLLTYLGAISPTGTVTKAGQEMSAYPLSPRFSKMLLIGHQQNCMPYTIALVSALAVSDLFVPENQLDLTPTAQDPNTIYTNEDRLEDTARETRRKAYNHAHHLFSHRDRTSDALKSLTALCAYAYATDTNDFCTSMFLRGKALTEATQLRQQLTSIIRTNRPGLIGPYASGLPKPTDMQLKALKQIVAAGYIDHVAIRADLSPQPPESTIRKPSRAIDVPYLTLFPSSTYTQQNKSGNEEEVDKAVYLHPSSVLAHTSAKSLPQYIIYSYLQRSTPSTSSAPINTKAPKIRMHALTAISGLQISALAQGTPLLEYSKPLGKVETLSRGDGGVERRECWVIPRLVGEKGGLGWPLPAKKVVQKRVGLSGWVIEE